MHEKTCAKCCQTFFFKNGQITRFKDDLCYDCYCLEGEMWVDSSLNLYYIDDKGYRISAPVGMAEALFE